ncbi:carbohydrate kinase family protein [Bailinhaonella thermotolerans]|uniref:Sugar kinase n=1 Tax=Bailinhaonella thermotolerans TaxID=1070861 RepID=A0A3A4B8V9_9ACTN|nr:sugar kinase [Bailinhaonella thermotolerans]RJL34124.1 sugar kinase [Bailinhaonella thermotolerans]
MSGPGAARPYGENGENGGGRLLVIGDVVTDVLALHGTPLAPGTDTAADIVVRPGGSAANTAAWASSLGADVRLLARVGADTAEWHRDALARAGVAPVFHVDEERPNAVVIAMVDGTGERTMLTNRGAGGRLGPGDWDDALLDGVTHLHVSGYLLFTELGRELGTLAFGRARERGVRVSLDPASTGPLAEFGVARFLELTGGADLVIPNRDEAALLTGVADPVEAARALSGTYGTAVVKLGSEGAVVARGGSLLGRAPAAPAELVDTTGAGDAFAGGFLAALLHGVPAETAIEYGCRAGATAVSHVGGRPPAADLADLRWDTLAGLA